MSPGRRDSGACRRARAKGPDTRSGPISSRMPATLAAGQLRCLTTSDTTVSVAAAGSMRAIACVAASDSNGCPDWAIWRKRGHASLSRSWPSVTRPKSFLRTLRRPRSRRARQSIFVTAATRPIQWQIPASCSFCSRSVFHSISSRKRSPGGTVGRGLGFLAPPSSSIGVHRADSLA